MERTDILILSASAGSGHMIAAQALRHAFTRHAPHLRTEVTDILSISNPYFRRLYGGGYSNLVQYMPTAMGWLYEAMDHPGGKLYNALRRAIQNLNRLPTRRHIWQRRPRLIVNTHYLPAEYVAQMKSAGLVHCPQVTVTTDFETHRIWAQEPTERYYTATDEGRYYLCTWGPAATRVKVTGIPVRPAFLETMSTQEARRQLELDPQQPTVLLLCGALSTAAAVQMLAELTRMPADAQVVAVAGRNEKLRIQLERVAQQTGRDVRLVGFTEQMHVYMRAASVAITKPGGLTVAEALVCGLPLVLINPIPGQETRNADFLLERGAAIKINNTRLLGFRASKLISDDRERESLRAAALANACPKAADEIVIDALSLIESHAD